MRSFETRLARLEQRAGVGTHAPLLVLWNETDPDPAPGTRCIRVIWVDAPPRETPTRPPVSAPRYRPAPEPIVSPPVQWGHVPPRPDPEPATEPTPRYASAPQGGRQPDAGDRLRAFVDNLNRKRI